MFFIAEKQQKTILNFSLNSLTEHQKILNLLSDANNSKLVTRNGALSVIIQKRITMYEMKLSITMFTFS